MLKLLSLFTGIGAFERALVNLEIPFELINYSEIDANASKAYSILHEVNEDKNLGDIFKIETSILPDFDLVTYGFPCQCFSLQGNQEGFLNKTKGTLFFESARIINDKQPLFAIGENVKALVSHDKGNTFKTILRVLDEIGYNTYFKVMNSSDFDILQIRERIFIVSIRKDIDKGFIFPKGQRTLLTMKDFVDVDEKKVGYGRKELNLHGNKLENHSRKEMSSGLIQLFNAIEAGFATNGYNNQKLYSVDGLVPTITTKSDCPSFYEIRRVLNAKEKLMLQGFTANDYIKLQGIISEAQIMKQAGNSITVNTIQAILKSLNEQYSLGDL